MRWDRKFCGTPWKSAPGSEAGAPFHEKLRNRSLNGWLPYNESKHGLRKGLITLMVVVQPNKKKMGPEMDLRSLNGHIAMFTADSKV
ncbi:hypothetical protein M514_25728 [Trichuris suis]|uniref:Uncharacterized protein n=1 Tax=Trichuris suis TaxID=68888 RepID=A0A085MY21_9BILA|nr:hypothetical protein M513_10676 [Trichuris suis]KFD62117.1 hypothetical protein M514_25719 [Trichuris suis]KFD62121.1 hypothetical protein M514_10676 [Trichuris suis]KFD62126.1 hypothetical protein M514_25728 [Trichuris suis]